MMKNYLAKKPDFLAVEDALRYVWDSKLDFIFQDKTVIRSTVVVSFDSKSVYLWSRRKFSNLSPIPCILEKYSAYKIPHRLLIAKEFQYAWHAGITSEIEALLPDAIKNSSRFSVPVISGGLLMPFTTLQKSFRRKNNPYTTRQSYLATIVHEFGHVYWNSYKLWWPSNKQENLRYLAMARKLYSNKSNIHNMPLSIPITGGIGEIFATCAEYYASQQFWPLHKKNLDKFAESRLKDLCILEKKKNLEQENSVLEPTKYPHDFAFVFGKLLLTRYPKTWPQILTIPHLLQSNR